MVDPVQAVLLVVIVLLTLLLLVLGIQIFFILKELRRTLSRATRVLENTESITESVSEPMSFLSGLLLSAKSLKKFSHVTCHMSHVVIRKANHFWYNTFIHEKGRCDWRRNRRFYRTVSFKKVSIRTCCHSYYGRL